MGDVKLMTQKEREEWARRNPEAVVARETEERLVKRIGDALGEVPFGLIHPTMEVPVWVVAQLLNELEEARWELNEIHNGKE